LGSAKTAAQKRLAWASSCGDARSAPAGALVGALVGGFAGAVAAAAAPLVATAGPLSVASAKNPPTATRQPQPIKLLFIFVSS
jgi:hypothetical protein